MQVWQTDAMGNVNRHVEFAGVSLAQVVEFLAPRSSRLQFRGFVRQRFRSRLQVSEPQKFQMAGGAESPRSKPRLSALAYLYDHMQSLPEWLRKLTPRQLEDIAAVMAQWDAPADTCILPLEEAERREVLRAIRFYGGNVIEAADALKIGKTTIYNKLKRWGYTDQSRILQAQAAVLAGADRSSDEQFW